MQPCYHLGAGLITLSKLIEMNFAMKNEKTFSVKLTSSEWGRVCLALMEKPGNGELHRRIFNQLPYLSDDILDSFNQ